MTDKEERWQKALKEWDTWFLSQQRARAEIETRYADKLPLIKDAVLEVVEKSDDPGNYRIRINDEQWVRLEIQTAVKRIADDFVSGEMGLPPGSDVHALFVDHWISTTLPLFKRKLKLTQSDEQLPKGRYITLEGKADKTNNRIVRSVTWYADEADHHEIARFLDWMPRWPIDVIKEQRHAGGPHKKDERILPEAIVCHVFREKRSFGEVETATTLQWKTEWTEGKRTCRLVRKRLALAKNIMQAGGNVLTVAP